MEKRKVTQLQDQLKDACIDTHLIDDEGIEWSMHLIDNEELELSIPELLPAENHNIPDNYQQVINPQIPAAETSDQIIIGILG